MRASSQKWGRITAIPVVVVAVASRASTSSYRLRDPSRSGRMPPLYIRVVRSVRRIILALGKATMVSPTPIGGPKPTRRASFGRAPSVPLREKTRRSITRLGIATVAGFAVAVFCGGQTVTEFLVPTPSSIPIGIVAGPDGNIWFTETHGNNVGSDHSGRSHHDSRSRATLARSLRARMEISGSPSRLPRRSVS